MIMNIPVLGENGLNINVKSTEKEKKDHVHPKKLLFIRECDFNGETNNRQKSMCHNLMSFWRVLRHLLLWESLSP